MNKRGINLYLHVHQPYRIRKYGVFDTGDAHDYFEEPDTSTERNNESVFHKVADKSYRPMTALLQQLLDKHPDFRLSLSITGIFLDQAERWTPDVLADFKRLVDTGRVEILAETYYHSLAFFYSRDEFERQVQLHKDRIRNLFGVETTAFRNTELAYNDQLAQWADEHGYKAILAEGWDTVLDWRSPNYVYRPAGAQRTALLLKNYRLSDDLAFRFSNRAWSEWPVTAEKYNNWVNESLAEGQIVNLFMDFETFGEHQWQDTGIFEFFDQFVGAWLADERNTFFTVSQTAEIFQPVDEISMPHTVTWADSERDLSAWTGSSLQREALHYLYSLEHDIIRSGDEDLIRDWRYLQASDLVYYMSTKWHNDGDVHAYFSPYDSPYDAFLYFINVIRDLRWRLMQHHRIGHLHD